MRNYLSIIIVIIISNNLLFAQTSSIDVFPKVSGQPGSPNYCSARLTGDTLIVENSRIKRVYLWNKGNIISQKLEDKRSDKVWLFNTSKPDMSFPGQKELSGDGSLSVKIVPENRIKPEHLEATVLCTLGKLQVKKVFSIFPNCPAIACTVYLRGQSESDWVYQSTNPADLKNIEQLNEKVNDGSVPILERLRLQGKQWLLTVVDFKDVTDRFNTLVIEQEVLAYRKNLFRGNLLFATDQTSGEGVFVLKESPTPTAQLAYPGGDFLSDFGHIRMMGANMQSSDLDPVKWTKACGFATGVYGDDPVNKLLALREYQQRIRLHRPDRDEMIMMNTWGDRSQDTKVDEAFCLDELDAGARLGITHFQLDDGWQTGRSGNSAFKGGSFKDIWRDLNYWKPDPVKFPDGLTPIIEKGKKLGIKIGIWFNPSSDGSYTNWEKDANALIALYKQYGILTFKIDGVNIADKQSEINFRKFMDKVVDATQGKVVFNLDVTAGRRGGYFSFNEYGNIFLENRYTDWQNYYPYWTLRNLWMLSKYIPPQNLQIEFLNKWRNTEKYKDELFAPENYSFDYLFATTMAGQPLAWFESTGLPETAFSVAGLIGRYKEVMFDFHSGIILPIGEEPSGRSWTGFQSQKEGATSGYVLVFREQNESNNVALKLPMLTAGTYHFAPIVGSEKIFIAEVTQKQNVRFSLDQPNSFALYKYVKIEKP